MYSYPPSVYSYSLQNLNSSVFLYFCPPQYLYSSAFLYFYPPQYLYSSAIAVYSFPSIFGFFSLYCKFIISKFVLIRLFYFIRCYCMYRFTSVFVLASAFTADLFASIFALFLFIVYSFASICIFFCLFLLFTASRLNDCTPDFFTNNYSPFMNFICLYYYSVCIFVLLAWVDRSTDLYFPFIIIYIHFLISSTFNVFSFASVYSPLLHFHIHPVGSRE